MCFYSGIVSYEYKGYKYEPMVEDLDDVIRIIHRVETPEGDVIELKFNDESYVSERDFRKKIDTILENE